MSITKTDNGKWLLNIKPGGRSGKQIRKTFKTKAEAKEFEIWARNQQKDPEWVFKRDNRKLKSLFEDWFKSHGQFLKSGEDTIARIKKFADEIGNPAICDVTAEHFTNWRAIKISEGMAENTCNRVHAYCKSAINELIRTGAIKGSNPFSKVRLLKIDETELSFLDENQIEKLLNELKRARNPHVYLITKICLSTGARWSEAEGLKISQLQGPVIQFTKTKSSKSRGVPIDDDLTIEIQSHFKAHGKDGKIFGSSERAFAEGLRRAEITLPDGQRTHVLRHTFSSHFIQGGGNILTLQRVLGHHTVVMTMRYAHLAPDHLADAVRLNPISRLKNQVSPAKQPEVEGYKSNENITPVTVEGYEGLQT